MKHILTCLLVVAAAAAPAAADTIVRFDVWVAANERATFDVQLFDSVTPVTVQNFLGYVNSGKYDSSVLHRLIPDFVLQGGGFGWTPEGLQAIATNAPIINEFEISNTRGTVAMAKLGSDPNSATSQFFFNLGDNSQNLDYQNEGFTVFGRVINDGMDLVDFLASQPAYNLNTYFPHLGGVMTDTPVIGDYLEELYSVQVVADVLVGDADGNGMVDASDAQAFALGLTDPEAYEALYPQLAEFATSRLDINRDGAADNLDIAPLSEMLSSGLVPEPATLLILGLGAVRLLRRSRK